MRSLQRHLSLGLAAGVTALWLLAAGLAGLVIRHELDEAFDSALQETAQRLLPLVVADILAQEAPSAETRRVMAVDQHRELLTYLVRDGAGRVVLQSHDADPADFPAEAAAGFRTTPSHRIYGEAAISGTLILEVADPLDHRRQATLEAALVLILPLLALIPLSFLGVWAMVRHLLRPVVALRAEIEARGSGNLSPVQTQTLPEELAPVAEAVNHLIDRLHRALEAERSFTANSAHELRTPLAAGLAQVQRLLAEAPDGPLRQRAEKIETTLHQLSRLSERLMQLARAEGGGLLAETPHDLAALIPLAIEGLFSSAAERARIRLSLPPPGLCQTRLDPDALAILLNTLIGNALSHGAEGGEVAVTLTQDGVLQITNRGPIVPPALLAPLKNRVQRGPTPAQGAGLGLAIAEAIVSGIGGRLDLHSPAPGQADGFQATISLPKTAERA